MPLSWKFIISLLFFFSHHSVPFNEHMDFEYEVNSPCNSTQKGNDADGITVPLLLLALGCQ